MIRVVLPQHLCTLARVDGDVRLDVQGVPTQRTVLDALEASYPVLRGTIRDHGTAKRRAFVRFFACGRDITLDPADDPLPEEVASGTEPFRVVAAMAGGQAARHELQHLDLACAQLLERGGPLTRALIGKMSGKIPGAVGEGMSDVLAIVINGDDRIGEYSFDDPLGIRRAPYTNYPRTYGNVTGAEVHDDGEVYAAIGWRLSERYLGQGLPTATLLGDLVDGMNYTPAGPYFEDMRDGILQSVAGSGRECLVWRAFADYGVGVGAKATVRGSTVLITESFSVPAGC